MTQATQVRLMNRVMSNTPGGGGSGILHLLADAVRLHAPNPEANEKVTHCANTLDDPRSPRDRRGGVAPRPGLDSSQRRRVRGTRGLRR